MKVLAVAIGIIFVILAILTATGAAHFAPAIGLDGQHHTKHTVLYAVIALLGFVWARMSTETPTTTR
jgi:tryptophan-rich sensory protein